jgi:hypothetical protein
MVSPLMLPESALFPALKLTVAPSTVPSVMMIGAS